MEKAAQIEWARKGERTSEAVENAVKFAVKKHLIVVVVAIRLCAAFRLEIAH